MPKKTKYNSPTKTALLVFTFLLIYLNQGHASELSPVSEILLEAPFSPKQTKQVLAGKIAATKIVPVSENELAQGVACLVKDGTPKNLDVIRTGTWLAPDQHIILSSYIADNASIANFKKLHFNSQNEHELQRFINAEAGDELNLSLQEISQLEQLKTQENKQFQKENTEQLIQSLLFSRHQKYRLQGAKGIAPYTRSEDEEIQPGKQLLTSLEESLGLKKLYPKLYSLLRQYPQPVNFAFSEDYYWYLVNLGDRPAIGLSHRMHSDIDNATFIIERGYYISHTIDSVQVLVGLIPVQEGMLLIHINRTWTEKISGLFSSIKRKIAHNIMISEMEHVMKDIHVCRNED